MFENTHSISFNSKLVRLKDSIVNDGTIILFMFQFQTGAIKSFSCVSCFTSLEKFQFQTGAIKSDAAKEYLAGLVTVFQFQTGAIKSLCGDQNNNTSSRFQFQTGAIKSCIILTY